MKTSLRAVRHGGRSPHLVDRMVSDIEHGRFADAQDVLTIQRFAHLVGGCRMGSSPEESVVDSDHRIWGTPNVYCCDGSVCPTQGTANPALTIMALASRLADRLSSGQASGTAGRPAVGAAA